MRFARVFMPELKMSDFQEQREVFLGFLTAAQFQLVKMAQEIDLAKWPDHPVLNAVRAELVRCREVEFPLLQETITAAGNLPRAQSTAFHSAFGGAIAKRTALQTIERLSDNHTAQICFFLMIMRPWIEGGAFKSISELFRYYVQSRELVPENSFPTVEAKASFQKQFSKICSECGLRLKGKGRPKKKSP